MLRHLALGFIALYERVLPAGRSECCAYRAVNGRAPCGEFAKRAIHRYGFFSGLGLTSLRLTECAESARALAASEVRYRDSLLARSSFMSQFDSHYTEHHDGDTVPMDPDAPEPHRPPPLYDLPKALGTPKVHVRRCGPFVWPRQYGSSASSPVGSRSLQPSH